MSSLVFEISQEGGYIWLLLLLGVVLSFLFLAQKRVIPFARAILRSTLSFFSSPFVYLRKTAGELCLGEANPRLLNVDHYLLKELLIGLQVALLLIFMLGCGFAVTTTFIALLPPSEMRHDLAEIRKAITETSAQSEADSAKLKQEDADWTNRRQELIDQAQTSEKQKKQDAQEALRADIAALQHSPTAARYLAAIESFFAQRQGYYGAVEEAKGFVNRIPSLDAQDTSHLLSYCDHWQELQKLSSKAPETEDAIRAEAQPDHEKLAGSVQAEGEQLTNLRADEQRLSDLCAQNYHPGRMAATFLLFALVGILYIWGAGLVIEAFSLSIYLANDVKQIRTRAETPQTDTTPAYQ